MKQLIKNKEQLMNKNPKISVILPVYNVVDYLEDCLKSIFNQTFEDFELIIVDDGSNDGSEYLCDEYGKNNEKVVVIHQKNAGLSAARNAGIKQAKGEFVTFIDSDDMVSFRYLEELLKTILNTSSDISICDYVQINNGMNLDQINHVNNKKSNEIILNKREAIEEVYKNKYHGIEFVTWAKLYKLKLFKENNIWFPNGRIHEDAFTTYKLFYISNRISYVDKGLYYYRIRSGSIMNSAFTEKRLDMIVATREEYKFFLEAKDYKLMKLAFFDYLHKVKLILKMMYNSNNINNELIKRVCQDLNEDINEFSEYVKIPFFKYIYYKGWVNFPKFFTLVDKIYE